MTPVIEDARRRQQRRRRFIVAGAAALAVIAGGAVLGARQFRSPGPDAGSTTLAKAATSTYTYVATQRDGVITIRRRGTTVHATVVPSMTLRHRGEGSAGAVVVLDPQTGAVLVRVVKGRQPYVAPAMTTR